MTREMQIETRVFDLLEWLLPKADKFPKIHRFTLTARLMQAALLLAESLALARATRGPQRRVHLADCDARLDHLRLYLRLVHRWRWLSDGQYGHVSAMVADIGRLLGGWLRQAEKVERAGP